MIEILAILFFLLTFLVVYGFLNKIKIFQTVVNAVVAMVVAFYSLLVCFLFMDDIQKIMGWSGIALLVAFGIALFYFTYRKNK